LHGANNRFINFASAVALNKQGIGIICNKIFFATCLSARDGPTENVDQFHHQTTRQKILLFRNASKEKRLRIETQRIAMV
jgi:hypothetical protein